MTISTYRAAGTATRTSGLVLGGSETSQVGRLAAMAADICDDFEMLLGTSEFADLVDRLPARLTQTVRDLADYPPDSGYLLIKGLPVGDLPDTPTGYAGDALGLHTTTYVLAMIGHLLGGLVGYEDEKFGALIHDVYPVRGDAAKAMNSGSVEFGLHTENVHHPLRPAHLGLLCLRPDRAGAAATTVASMQEALELLPERVREVLTEERFRSLAPLSFSRGRAVRQETRPHPVVAHYPGGPGLRFDSDNTRGTDPEAADALDLFGTALFAVARRHRVGAGGLLIVDNRMAAHGRSAFTPRYDGRDRWLRRFYSYPTALPPHRVLRRGGRVVSAQIYSDLSDRTYAGGA